MAWPRSDHERGQEGLSWDRWRRICHDADTLGFDSLRRSDHLISLMGAPERDCIECWTSLALAAEWTKRIEFGPMVSPITFRPPGVLAKIAASVDVRSGGRVILGVGAGWNENEHREFGIPFYTQKERFDLLEQGVRIMRDTWKKSNPKPARNPMPLLIGGKGQKRTLPIVAREASEWNLSRLDADMYNHAMTYWKHAAAKSGAPIRPARGDDEQHRPRSADFASGRPGSSHSRPERMTLMSDRNRRQRARRHPGESLKRAEHESLGVDLFLSSTSCRRLDA